MTTFIVADACFVGEDYSKRLVLCTLPLAVKYTTTRLWSMLTPNTALENFYQPEKVLKYMTSFCRDKLKAFTGSVTLIYEVT